MIIVTFAVILESQVTWSLVAFTSSWRFIYWVFKFLVASVSKLSETVTSQHRNVMVSLPMRMLIKGVWFDVVDSLFSGAWVELFSAAYMSWIKKKGPKKGLINTSAIRHVYNSRICSQFPWDVEALRLEDYQKQGKRTVELDEKRKKKCGRKCTENEQLEVLYKHSICTGVFQWSKSLLMTRESRIFNGYCWTWSEIFVQSFECGDNLFAYVSNSI